MEMMALFTLKYITIRQTCRKIATLLGCSLFLVLKVNSQDNDLLKVTQAEDGILVEESNIPVLFYQTRNKKINNKFDRAGYVHPLYDWYGKELTEDGPADHPHHRGIFWAWHQLIWKDSSLGDGWLSENIRFRNVSAEWNAYPDRVEILSKMVWHTASDNLDRDIIFLTEETNIAVHNQQDSFRIIDFDIRLFPVVDSLKIGGADDYKGYGGFSFRLKQVKDLLMLTRDSIIHPQDKGILGSPWINFQGTFNGEELSAVALMCRTPYPGPDQEWILRNAAAPSSQNAVFPGRTPRLLHKNGWRLRYRLVVQKKLLSPKTLEDIYQEYVAKP